MTLPWLQYVPEHKWKGEWYFIPTVRGSRDYVIAYITKQRKLGARWRLGKWKNYKANNTRQLHLVCYTVVDEICTFY